MKKHKMMLKVMLERLEVLTDILDNEDLPREEGRVIQEIITEINDLLFDMGYIHVDCNKCHRICKLGTKEVIVEL